MDPWLGGAQVGRSQASRASRVFITPDTSAFLWGCFITVLSRWQRAKTQSRLSESRLQKPLAL